MTATSRLRIGEELVDGDPDGDGQRGQDHERLPALTKCRHGVGSGTSQTGEDNFGDDDAPSGRRGDESMIAQAHLPVSLEQQRRRRQWAFGGTAAVAVVACALLIKGLSGSSGGNDNASLPDITVATAPASVATTPTSAATATSAATPTTIGTPLDPLAVIPTVRNAPAQYGFYLDGDIVLQGTVPTKSKGAEMKIAAGDLVGNDHVKPAYTVKSSAPTVPHPPLYIANPIRFDKSGNLDAVSQAAVKSAADLMIAAPAARMAVLGFTSAKGSPSNNLALSKHRADAVLAELVRLGVPREQLFAQGRGSTDPMADNTTSKGRDANDRVELVGAGPPRLIRPGGQRRLGRAPARRRRLLHAVEDEDGLVGDLEDLGSDRGRARRPTPAPARASVLPRHLEHCVLIEDVARTLDRGIEVDEARRIGRDRVEIADEPVGDVADVRERLDQDLAPAQQLADLDTCAISATGQLHERRASVLHRLGAQLAGIFPCRSPRCRRVGRRLGPHARRVVGRFLAQSVGGVLRLLHQIGRCVACRDEQA